LIGIGAIAAAGAFFVGKALGEEEAEAKLNAQQYYQNRQQQLAQATAARARQVPPSASPALTSDEEEDDDPKSGSGGVGLEKECAICMCEFEVSLGPFYSTPCII